MLKLQGVQNSLAEAIANASKPEVITPVLKFCISVQ